MSRRAKRRKRRSVQPDSQPVAQSLSPEVPSDLLNLPAELLERLPEETRVAYIQSASFRGPLPPPALFGQYEEILEGSANRILQLTELEQRHRQRWELTAMGLQGADMRRGQWMGFLLGAFGIVAAVFCAYLDRPYIAGLSIGTVLAGILTAFFMKLPKSSSDD